MPLGPSNNQFRKLGLTRQPDTQRGEVCLDVGQVGEHTRFLDQWIEHCDHPTHGRPTVEGEDRISFSLSHSGSFAVIALADGALRIGVDVEEVKPRRRLAALAARVLNDDEHAAWIVLAEGDEQLRSFLRAWTTKEAYLKALGIGIATRLRDVPARVEGWQTCELSVGEARIAALAVDRRDFAVEHALLAPLATSNGGTAG